MCTSVYDLHRLELGVSHMVSQFIKNPLFAAGGHLTTAIVLHLNGPRGLVQYSVTFRNGRQGRADDIADSQTEVIVHRNDSSYNLQQSIYLLSPRLVLLPLASQEREVRAPPSTAQAKHFPADQTTHRGRHVREPNKKNTHRTRRARETSARPRRPRAARGRSPSQLRTAANHKSDREWERERGVRTHRWGRRRITR